MTGKMYLPITLNKDTLRAIIVGLKIYQRSLSGALKEVKDFDIENSLLEKEKELIDRLIENAQKRESSNKEFDVEFSYDERLIKIYKSCLLLYLRNLEIRRAILVSEKKGLPKILLDEADSRISFVKDKLNLPIFKNIEPSDILIGDSAIKRTVKVEESTDNTVRVTTKTEIQDTRNENIVKEEFFILDKQLKGRVIDLIAKNKDGLYDRPIREVAVVIEDRLRKATGLKDDGITLASKALNPKTGRLVVSNNENEQEGISLIFQGFFRFIRNDKNHKLDEKLTRERAIQIVVFGDYLLSLIEGSRVKQD